MVRDFREFHVSSRNNGQNLNFMIVPGRFWEVQLCIEMQANSENSEKSTKSQAILLINMAILLIKARDYQLQEPQIPCQIKFPPLNQTFNLHLSKSKSTITVKKSEKKTIPIKMTSIQINTINNRHLNFKSVCDFLIFIPQKSVSCCLLLFFIWNNRKRLSLES